MVELQKYIVSQLKSIHPRVYLEEAIQQGVFPYVVYKLPDSSTVNRREDFVLELDIWDKPSNGSTENLQLLSDSIDKRFNRLIYVDSNGWNVRFYRINRLMVPDSDPSIRRRQLRYEAKTYREGS